MNRLKNIFNGMGQILEILPQRRRLDLGYKLAKTDEEEFERDLIALKDDWNVVKRDIEKIYGGKLNEINN